MGVGIQMSAASWMSAYPWYSTLDYPLLCDTTGSTYSSYYFDGYVPLNYVIDGDGIIRYRDSGSGLAAILAVVEEYAAPDDDGDGYSSLDDCDDTDPTIHPCATEICGDGIDQDCSGGDRACDAPDEIEPNDTPGDAQSLGSIAGGAAVQGHLCSTGSDGFGYTGDHDYFRFISGPGGDVTFTLDWDNSANFDIWIYRSDGVSFVAKDTTISKPAVVEVALDAGMLYVAKIVGYSGQAGDYTLTIEPEAAAYTLALDASYASGTMSLEFTVGTPEAATWGNYLVLTSPGVQVIPLFSVPLPAIASPITLPLAFPFPSLGTVGIYSGLFTAGGAQATVLEWVSTGK